MSSIMRIILLAFMFLAPALQVQEPDSAWKDFGYALAGTLGEPLLTGEGQLTPDSLVTVSLTGALADAPGLVVFSFQALFEPLYGGTVVPWGGRINGAMTDGDGNISMSGRMPGPGGMAPGDLFVQVWIVDPGGPEGFAASNALQGFVRDS